MAVRSFLSFLGISSVKNPHFSQRTREMGHPARNRHSAEETKFLGRFVEFRWLAQLYVLCKGGDDEAGESRMENVDARCMSSHLCKKAKVGQPRYHETLPQSQQVCTHRRTQAAGRIPEEVGLKKP
jgi:hypothetical protein